jgi:hypothetical protein
MRHFVQILASPVHKVGGFLQSFERIDGGSTKRRRYRRHDFTPNRLNSFRRGTHRRYAKDRPRRIVASSRPASLVRAVLKPNHLDVIGPDVGLVGVAVMLD